MKKVKETQVQSELSNQIKFIWDFFPSNSAVRSKKIKFSQIKISELPINFLHMKYSTKEVIKHILITRPN